jgi:uncharacterized protein YndB with AHSA1/START domain
MATFQNTVTIRRPIEDVFAFLADFENIPTWNYAIEQTRKTSPGPIGVGTTYRQIRTIPSRSEEGFEVTGFEPTRRLEIRGDIGPFAATVSYLLAPMGGTTQLTNAVDLAPSSRALRLLAPLAASRVKAAVAANLDTLRRIPETGQPTVSSASGWPASHEASVRQRIKEQADKLPHETDPGVLDSLARSINKTEGGN